MHSNYLNMEVVNAVADLRAKVDIQKKKGKRIGFVPTMGALHEGHLSLVQQAGEQSDFVVVSIFVNPTQFNDPKDLEKYPRDLEADLGLLDSSPCQLVFAPDVQEMYPEPDKRTFEFGSLGEVMEGKHRPGHFNGVAQVVSKLFDMVRPDKAFFGLKDFQQLAIVNRMVEQLNMPVEIVPCNIVREPDGLAMSSRNRRLSPEERKSAVLISQTLFQAVKKQEEMELENLKAWVIQNINSNIHLEVEYFDIVDDKELRSIKRWDETINKIGCIAVVCGKVRLIDNVTF